MNKPLTKRGRKPESESRAEELHAKLLAWKQTPESRRISLRALAVELGTSHQLLSHYLRGWKKWEAKEYRRRASEIIERAETENRILTPWEQQQVRDYEWAYFQWMIESALSKHVKRLGQEAKTGPLNKTQIRLLRLCASKGILGAQEVLDKAW